MVFNANEATQAYIVGLGEQALAQAAAYTSGSHWLMLWGLIVAMLVTLLVVRSGLLSHIASGLEGRNFFIRGFCISAAFVVLSGIIELPWSIYSGWWREMSYGRTSQPLADFPGSIGFGGWL